jgi:Zn-dependent alcohol dehydrogenase
VKSEAVIYERYGKPLFIDEIVLDPPGPHEVAIKVNASGICGSQLINLANKNSLNPEILGHEATGIVLQAGSHVEHVSEGDDVIVSWMPYGATEKTNYLEWCNAVSWRHNRLRTLIFSWARHAVMHSQFVSKMDSDLNKKSAAVIGCAGIAGYGTVNNSVRINSGDSVAVFGVGGLGLLAVNAAKNLGADPIIAVDIDHQALSFAQNFGATHLVNSSTHNAVEEISKISDAGVDFVFDMVGAAEIRETTILAAKAGVPGFRKGGSVVLVGFPHGASDFNPRSILMGERSYIGSRGGGCIPAQDFPRMFSDYRNSKMLLDDLVTKVITIDEINDAMDELRNGKVLGRIVIDLDN